MAKLLAVFLALVGIRSFVLGVSQSLALHLTKEGRTWTKESEKKPLVGFAIEVGLGALAWVTLFFFSAVPIWIAVWLWHLE